MRSEFMPPYWMLATERCRCCGAQGELEFSTCPACGFVVLICAEIGTVYDILGKRAGLSLGWIHDQEPAKRKRCGSAEYDTFLDA